LVIDEVKTKAVKEFIKKDVIPTLNDVETAMDETWFHTQMNVITSKFAKELELAKFPKKKFMPYLKKNLSTSFANRC